MVLSRISVLLRGCSADRAHVARALSLSRVTVCVSVRVAVVWSLVPVGGCRMCITIDIHFSSIGHWSNVSRTTSKIYFQFPIAHVQDVRDVRIFAAYTNQQSPKSNMRIGEVGCESGCVWCAAHRMFWFSYRVPYMYGKLTARSRITSSPRPTF